MKRHIILATIVLVLFGACSSNNSRMQSNESYYLITKEQANIVSFRVLDGVNALRASRSLQPLSFNAALNAAATTHSRDMSIQNRPWHFGSDSSSPLDRVRRAQYDGILIGETISETFETEMATLAAWLRQNDTRAIILDPRATDLGFSWFQEPNGKIWWTLIMGRTESKI